MVNLMKGILGLVSFIVAMRRDGLGFREIARVLDWGAALQRAVERTGDVGLYDRTNVCTVELRSGCLRCCAIERAIVLHYLGAIEPPAPGSSWSTMSHWPEIDAELAAIGGIGASCETCRPIREASVCRCGGGGACAVRAGMAS